MRNIFLVALLNVIFCFLLFVLCGGLREDGIIGGTLTYDSDSYLKYASYLAGVPLKAIEVPHIDESILLQRQPFYPMVLSLAIKITGNFSAELMLLTHLLLYFLCSITGILILSAYINPFISSVFCLLSAFIMKDYALMLLTEWTAYCLLLVYFSFLYLSLVRPSIKAGWFLGLAISLLILTRPEFIICIFTLVIFFLKKDAKKVRSMIGALLGIAFLLVPWGIYNSYRSSEFRIFFFESSLISVATLFGPIDTDPKDDQVMREAIFNINQFTQKIDRADYIQLPFLSSTSLVSKVSLNYWNGIAHAPGNNYLEKNSNAFKIGLRAILQHPWQYCLFVFLGTSSLFYFLPLLILPTKKNSALTDAKWLFFIIIFIRTLLISGTNITHFRYVMPVLAVFVFISLVCYWEKISPSSCGSKI